MSTRTPNRLEPRDLLDLAAITGTALSPDGAHLAYLVRTEDVGADVHRDRLWLASRDAATGTWASRPLTSGEHAASDPAWSPDGTTLAFVSAAGSTGAPQVHVLSLPEGAPRVLTTLPDGASDPTFSPDGRRIAFVALDRDLQGVPENPLVRHIRRLPYRTPSGGWVTDRFTHVWVAEVETGEARQLTFGPWNDGSPAFSPDGTRLAFTSLRHRTPVVPLAQNAVYVVGAEPAEPGPDGSDAAVAVTAGLEGVGAPSWHPDGTRIACSAMAQGLQPWLASHRGIYVCPTDGGRPERADEPSTLAVGLAIGSDPAVSFPLEVTWAPDGRTILYGAVDAGRMGVYRLDPATHVSVLILGGERAIAAVSLAADGSRIAYLPNDWTTPGDLYVANADGTGEERVTHLNDAWSAGHRTSWPEPLRVPTTDGRFTLDTWLFRPVGTEPGRTYPLVQLVHGGPDGTFGPAFHFVVQLLANRGFAVQLVNCRGGLSYGAEFDAALDGHYGVNDEHDFWDAIDAAVASGGIDGSRVGIHGHSYGGFMAAWMPGRTDRYKAAVASAIMANFTTQSLTAFYGGTHSWSEGGQWPDMWADPAEWWRRSPIGHVPQVQAPILLLMSEEDRITSPFEHEQLFAALLSEGKTAEMVRFVGEGHGVEFTGAPSVRAERTRLIVDWFERWLAPVQPSTRPLEP